MIGFTSRYVAMATSSYTNFSGSVTSGQTYGKTTVVRETSRIGTMSSVRNRGAGLHLHHGFVLLLQLLVRDAVLLHREQRQGAAELAALVLRGPAHQLRQQVGGEPGRLGVGHAIREPDVWSQRVQLQGPAGDASTEILLGE